MPREATVYLEDILESCRKIRRYTEGMTVERFRSDEKTVDAVIRNLEVIGEGARQIPPEVRGELPGIDWQRMAAMRNVLIHAYFGVDLDIVWDVVSTKLPGVESTAQRFLDAQRG